MNQPDESNPISDSSEWKPSILPDQSSSSAFWTHLSESNTRRQELGLFRERVISRPVSPTLIERNGRRLVQFGSNDYLGLSFHLETEGIGESESDRQSDLRDLSTAAKRFGSGASPLVTGNSPHHQELAEAIAVFEGTEDAIVFSSGFAANMGTIAALASSNDVIFSDQLNHASLIDGCRLSKAKVHVYPHCDVEELRRMVQRHRREGRFAFVVSDSVFSMDGDVAPVIELVRLCDEYEMMCVLDEAHATGVYGHYGRGVCEQLGLDSQRLIRIGTLSKAVGCMGGFVSGNALLIDWLSNHARSWIYSTAMPIPNVVRAKHAITVIQTMHESRLRLSEMSKKLRSRLRSLGLDVGSGDSPIIPVTFRTIDEVMAASTRLQQAGVYVPAIRPPTVPVGRSMLRISLCALHSDAELDHLVGSFADFQ